MAIHNWVRCHWRNGRHDLQDLPDAWRATLESHLASQRTRAGDLGVVRVARVESLAIAWVVCEVPLGAGECGFTYRRARALHALVRPLATGGAWDVPEAERLLGQRYGEPVSSGLAAQHRALSQLDFPEDAGQALGLFVGREQALPSELVPAPASAAKAPVGETGPCGEGAQRTCFEVAEDDDRPASDRGASVDSTHTLERWFERFTLISRGGAGATREGRARPAAAPLPVQTAEPAPLEPRTAPVSCDGSECATPAEGIADEDRVPRDEADDGIAPEALFDLSAPPAARADPPASSLSGLLGPSHTTAC